MITEKLCGIPSAHRGHKWQKWDGTTVKCPGLKRDLTKLEIVQRLVDAEYGDYFNASDLRAMAEVVLDHERRLAS